jgi:GntR family transcriptional repressor for pyruvate dehydrogenase complex
MARAVYVSTLDHLSSTASSPFEAEGPAAATYPTERHRVHFQLVEAIAAGDLEAVSETVAAHNTTH